MAMIRKMSCGMSVAAEMYSLMCKGVDMIVVFLYVSLLTTVMAPADRRFVVGSN